MSFGGEYLFPEKVQFLYTRSPSTACSRCHRHAHAHSRDNPPEMTVSQPRQRSHRLSCLSHPPTVEDHQRHAGRRAAE